MEGKIKNLIKENVKVVDQNGNQVVVNYVISTNGGEGDVYHATYKGKDLALKWFGKYAPDVIGGKKYKNIEKLRKHQSPSEAFIWPQLIVTEPNAKDGMQFGILMELIPDGYVEMSRFLIDSSSESFARFNSYNAMLTAGMNFAVVMQALHAEGLVYMDLRPENFYINPDTGDLLVVDVDNISVNGNDKDKPSGVKGTMGYMAPEIPRSKYKKNPSRQTDYYSLAVILYRLFFIDHPMWGKAWEQFKVETEEVEEFLYALKPVFQFDPSDDSNRPTDMYGVNAALYWKWFPDEVLEKFVVSFTQGINDPASRLPEIAWIEVLARARDALVRVGKDRAERFVYFDDASLIPKGCLKMIIINNDINKGSVAMYPGKAVYDITVTGNLDGYKDIVGGIVYDKEQKKMMIKNLSKDTWRAVLPGEKKLVEVKPAEKFPIVDGTMIEFKRDGVKAIGKVVRP